MVDCIIRHGTLVKGVLNNAYPLQMVPSASMVGRQPLDIATKKTISSTVEAIHASIETLGTIE
jgi:hypothetical protein